MMTGVAPLNVLSERASRVDPPVEEALFLSFNMDLGFFEREVLGLLQMMGTRITLIGDARMSRHDLYAIQRAGVSYLPGYALCPGSFHPKLIVLAGPDDAIVSIGSGNLSLAGWRGNDELWSTHAVSSIGGSRVPAEIGGFLSALPSDVQMAPLARHAIERVSKLLRRHPGDVDTGQLVSSLESPILEQLPDGPVDELLLYAPFQDSGARAISALVDRLEPSSVRVAYQPESTVVDGPALSNLLHGRGELVPIKSDPYRHGKLIEWAKGQQRWVLTGSPNLSTRALLLSVEKGANVELAVLTPIDRSLFPDADADATSQTHVPPYRRTSELPAPPDVILAAVRTNDGVVISLGRALKQPAWLQYSGLDDAPERWSNLKQIPAGAFEHRTDRDLAGGTRLRLLFDDGRATEPAFVCDAVLLERVRSGRRITLTPPPIPEVLVDPEAAARLYSILKELRPVLRAQRPRFAAGSENGADTDRSVGDWQAYLDRCGAQLGSALLSFALGLPNLRVADTIEGPRRNWDDEGPIVDDGGVLEDDQVETRPEPTAVDQRLVILERTAEALERYRRFSKQIAESSTDALPHEALVFVRLQLLLAASHIWPSNDLTWTRHLLTGISGFDDFDSPDFEEAAGSLAALALVLIDRAYRAQSHPVDRADFRRTCKKVSHLLIGADSSRILEYRDGLGSFCKLVTDNEIQEFVESIVYEDPIEASLVDLEDRGIEIVRNGLLLRATEAVSNPEHRAREIRQVLRSVDAVAIRVPGKKTGDWAVLVVSSPDEVCFIPGAMGRSVRVDHVRVIGHRRHDIAHTSVRDPIPAETKAVLEKLGLSVDSFFN